MNPIPPLRSKQWTSDHDRLADACERARFRIRRLIPDVSLKQQMELSEIANELSQALKAWPARRGLPCDETNKLFCDSDSPGMRGMWTPDRNGSPLPRGRDRTAAGDYVLGLLSAPTSTHYDSEHANPEGFNV